MQRHGVATMMLLGPTESVVVADDTADPMRLAADLLIEAEHGTDTSVVLHHHQCRPRGGDRCRARRAARRPADGAGRRGPGRARRATAAACSSTRSTTRSRSRTGSPPSTSRSRSPTIAVDDVVGGLVNAGEILVGQHTPFSAANFVIGCPASLPTSGFAHVSSGITAATFLKRTAVARADERALEAHGAIGHRARRSRGFPGACGGVATPSTAEPLTSADVHVTVDTVVVTVLH